MRIGVDLGGTKIEAIALDRDGTEHGRRRVPDAARAVRRDPGARSRRWSRDSSARPGEPATGRHRDARRAVPRHRAREERQLHLAQRSSASPRTSSASSTGPLRFANDANCFALSEARGRGRRGRARRLRRHPRNRDRRGRRRWTGASLTGPNAIAGEWGHNPLPWPRAGEWPGPACYCGRTGCIETFLSGPGLARDHREATGEDAGRGGESPRVPPPATSAARPRSPATRSGSRARWRRSSTSSTRT